MAESKIPLTGFHSLCRADNTKASRIEAGAQVFITRKLALYQESERERERERDRVKYMLKPVPCDYRVRGPIKSIALQLNVIRYAHGTRKYFVSVGGGHIALGEHYSGQVMPKVGYLRLFRTRLEFHTMHYAGCVMVELPERMEAFSTLRFPLFVTR